MTPLIARQERIRRRLTLAGDWRSGPATDRAEQQLFDVSFELAEGAREFEQAVGQRASAPATAAAMGCIASALEAQATGLLKMRSLAMVELSESEQADEAADMEDLGRLLYAISQNLRFAAQAADLARKAASRALEPPAAA